MFICCHFQRPESPDDPMAGYQDPVYDETVFDRIPEEFQDYSLENLVHNRIELEHFRQFLAENYASMDLMCWMDMEAFRRIPHTEDHRREMKAKDIKTKYLNKKYFFGPNSPAGKESQDNVSIKGPTITQGSRVRVRSQQGPAIGQGSRVRVRSQQGPAIGKGSRVRVRSQQGQPLGWEVESG